jgi:hypothetical protein
LATMPFPREPLRKELRQIQEVAFITRRVG